VTRRDVFNRQTLGVTTQETESMPFRKRRAFEAPRSFFLHANPIRSQDFDGAVAASLAITGRSTMKPYVFSLLAGILAGVIYGAIGVNSPAPPIIALTGLLGMLAGEQILPVARRMLAGHRLNAAWRDAKCSQHMFGPLPGGSTNERTPS
jgi:XapX domain-containing protein